MATYGGIDLGGTKIQTVIVDEDHKVLGSARRPTPTTGGPGGRRGGDGGGAARRRQGRRARARGARGRRGRLAGHDRGRQRDERPQPARLGRHASRSRRRSKAGSAARSGSATTCRWRPTPSSSSAPAGPTDSLLGVFWGTGVGGGLILDGKPWTGRGAAGEIGHIVVEIDGARCTCGRRGCMEAYAGRASMEAHARRLVEKKGARPTCSS